MTKALETLKEIQQQKPFIYSITSVWCRTVITNEPTRINEVIEELEELMKPKTCEGCAHKDEDASTLPCVACIRNVDTDYYDPKETK